VHPVLPFGVRAQQRADEEHRRAGGADERGDEGTEAQEQRVDAGIGADVPSEMDPPGDDEQREEQDDELRILHERVGDGNRPVEHGDVERDRDSQREREEQLAAIVIPPAFRRWNEWKDCDAQQQRRELNNCVPAKRGFRGHLGSLTDRR